ncbi:hypothetical protein [Undibacterium sp.]|uniref:hypothetical protein n=1 Tax=Undibacterium sp. TaxID=1914977 RepID=UPI00374FED35
MNIYLLAAAVCTSIAALLHFACIVFGAPLFRILGAGDVVVKMVEQGYSQPKWMAFFVGAALLICSAFTLSAAGVLMQLPWQRFVLCGLAVVLIVRALAFPWMKEAFPGNSEFFWWSSSAICLLMGLLHAIGVAQLWKNLT